jgi:DNA-binding GntR family transcriptional regulator
MRSQYICLHTSAFCRFVIDKEELVVIGRKECQLRVRKWRVELAGGRLNSSAEIRDQIEDEIIAGDLKPGEHLDESSLAKRFGVSRTPVREALLQLGISGLVVVQAHKGATVSRVGPEALVQMFEVMAELEGMAARLAARRCSQQEKEYLKEVLETCRLAADKDDTDHYYYANEKFHQAIYRASHNTFLAEQCLHLQRRLRPYRRLQLRAINRMVTSLREHSEIIEAITSLTPAIAEQRARAHVLIQGDRFDDLIAVLVARDQESWVALPSVRRSG